MIPKIRGVLAPVVTPFDQHLMPDTNRFIAHCRWLQSEGAGLAVFGTNSEANSQSVAERMHLLDAVVSAGVDPHRMMPGTGTTALPDTVQLTRHAVAHQCAGVLMLPPFYYKGVTEEGLFRYFSEVVQRVGSSALRIYLYHIPAVAVVGISPGLVERLLKAYPGTIAGMKDSSGDWSNTLTFLEAFGTSGFDVFAGSESFLLATLRHGGAGCISATANINPAKIHQLYAHWQQNDADARQAELDGVRQALARAPNMIAAMKAVMAHSLGDHEWGRVRPPLVELEDAAVGALMAELTTIGFALRRTSGQ